MNLSKSILLLILSLSLVNLSSCGRVPSDTLIKKNSLIETVVDSIVHPYITDSLIAGTVIGVAQKGKLIFLKSYGYSNLDEKMPMGNNSVFPIASVTKPFTAIATMQLVEKGSLALDDNIQKYIEFDTKDKIVTVRQLLNHTSGIKDYTELNIADELDGKEYSPHALFELLEKKKFDFEPGEAMDYNNSGYYLLALLIEKVSGLTYEEYLKENVFQPVKMNRTVNGYSLPENFEIVSGYNMNNLGKLEAAVMGDFRMATGAGSLYSTVDDLLKWQIAFHHSKRLLKNDGYQAMTTANKLPNGGITNYGLGLEINQHKGNKVLSHNGVIQGHLSDARYFPESDLSVVTLINTLGKIKPTNVSNSVADYFITEKNITKSFSGDLNKLSGNYFGSVMGNDLKINVLQENGQLLIESRGNKMPIQYIGGNIWLADDGYSYIFLEDKMQINAPKLSVIFNKEV